MLTNFHTHTQRCLHAYGSERDYVLSAVQGGLSALGFSDHGPFPDFDFGYRMAFDELDEYLAAISALQDEFAGTISLYKGLEIEFHEKYTDYYHRLLSEHGLDYLAMGEHTYYDGGELKNIFFAESTDDYLHYADNVCRGMRSGLFRFAAHPDLFFINALPVDRNAETACDKIIDEAVHSRVLLEFNANGLRRPQKPYDDSMRHPYPHELFWRKAAEAGVPVIIGADAHAPQQVYDDSVRLAHQKAREIGLKISDTIFEGV